MKVKKHTWLTADLALVTCTWSGARRQIKAAHGHAVNLWSSHYSARFLVGSRGADQLDGDAPPLGWTRLVRDKLEQKKTPPTGMVDEAGAIECPTDAPSEPTETQ